MSVPVIWAGASTAALIVFLTLAADPRVVVVLWLIITAVAGCMALVHALADPPSWWGALRMGATAAVGALVCAWFVRGQG